MRQVPLKDSLHHPDGPLQAHLYLCWVGQNMPGYIYRRKAATLVSSSICSPRSLCYMCIASEARLESMNIMQGWALIQTTVCCLQGLSTFASVHSALQTKYKNDLRNSQNPHNLVSACQRVLVAVQL